MNNFTKLDTVQKCKSICSDCFLALEFLCRQNKSKETNYEVALDLPEYTALPNIMGTPSLERYIKKKGAYYNQANMVIQIP
jgi:hypothetical protein